MGLLLVVVEKTLAFEQPPLSSPRLEPRGLQLGLGNHEFFSCLPRIQRRLVYSSVFRLRVYLPVSSRELSTHVRSVYQVGRRRVAGEGQDKLRRGI